MTTSRTQQLLDKWDDLTRTAPTPPVQTATSSGVRAPLGAALVGATVLAAVLVQGRLGVAAPGPAGTASSPTPSPTGLPVVRDYSAPGSCSQTTEFAYVGDSTLTDLGFGESSDLDFSRPGHFWITAYPVPRVIGFGQPEGPLASPILSPERMLCVKWLDGNPRGLKEMDVPKGWPETPLPS